MKIRAQYTELSPIVVLLKPDNNGNILFLPGNDTVKSWRIQADGSSRKVTGQGAPAVGSQDYLYEIIRRKSFTSSWSLRSGQGISVMIAGTVTDIGGLSPIRFWQNAAVASLIIFVRSIRSIRPPFVGFSVLVVNINSVHTSSMVSSRIV